MPIKILNGLERTFTMWTDYDIVLTLCRCAMLHDGKKQTKKSPDISLLRQQRHSFINLRCYSVTC